MTLLTPHIDHNDQKKTAIFPMETIETFMRRMNIQKLKKKKWKRKKYN